MSWIELSTEGSVATITLTAPGGPSRINVESAREWLRVLEEIEGDESISVVVIRADGPVWSAGGDLREFQALGAESHDFILEIGEWINPVVGKIYNSDKLTIASVHGAVAGGGLGPMLACDFVIAEEGTNFTLGYSKLATNPDAGVSWFLPRIVGYRKALELYLTSELLDAEAARELGLINVVASSGELEGETRRWVERISALPPHAVRATKALLKESAISPLDDHTDREIRSFAENTKHPEFVEGVTSFLKRD